MLLAALLVLTCYLLGSIPFPIIISRFALGIDLREHGSGNMGAMNAARVLGKRWFPLVFGLDLAKGAVATLLAQWLLPGWIPIESTLAATIGGLVAVFGHCFPIFAGFRGGVGLATTGGALLVLSPLLGLSGGAAILLFWGLSRNLYVGTAAAALTFPLLGWYWLRIPGTLITTGLWGLLVFLLHWNDLRAWLTGHQVRR